MNDMSSSGTSAGGGGGGRGTRHTSGEASSSSLIEQSGTDAVSCNTKSPDSYLSAEMVSNSTSLLCSV